jgi:5-oxoprolinase (ATP-hydrolysing)
MCPANELVRPCCNIRSDVRNAHARIRFGTHMTNTWITDPEVLEKRYPVRVHEFRIRHGSGMHWSGGDGQHRGGARGPYPPYGIAGGRSGKLGINQLQHADGSIETLPALAQFTVEPGDRLTIETPGGGGFGDNSIPTV